MRLLMERVRLARALTQLHHSATAADLAAVRAAVPGLTRHVRLHQRLEQQLVACSRAEERLHVARRERLRSEHAMQRRVLRAFVAAIEREDVADVVITAISEQLVDTLRKDFETLDGLLSGNLAASGP